MYKSNNWEERDLNPQDISRHILNVMRIPFSPSTHMNIIHEIE